MGIPIDLPSPDSPTFRPTHSAKPSWSNQPGDSLYHTSNSQPSSSSPSSSVRLQSTQSIRSYEPSSSTSIWGTSMSSPLTQSPVSFTSPIFPRPHPERSSAIHGTFAEQSSSHTTSVMAPHTGTDQELSGTVTTQTEIEIPLHMHPHPNLRRVTRMPVFVATASASTAHSNSQAMAAGTVSDAAETITGSAHGLDALTTSSLAHHQTRPLPPPPSPPQSLGSRTSLTGNSASSYPPPQQQGGSGAQNETPTWNYRFVNRNHADNRGRIERRRLGDRVLDGYYYEDVRLRHENSRRNHDQHHHHALTQQGRTAIIAAARSVRMPEVIRGHDIYENEVGYQRWYLERQLRQHHQQEHGRESSLDTAHALSILATSSRQNAMRMNTIPSFLQNHPGTTRTIIRADPILPGVIHIYPEDHAPIWMYGRPILSSSSARNMSTNSISNCSSASDDTSYSSAGTILPTPATLNLQDASEQQQDVAMVRASSSEITTVSNLTLPRLPSASLSSSIASGELFQFAPLISTSFPSSMQQENPRIDENNTSLDDYTQMSIFATMGTIPTSGTTILNTTTTETTRPPPRHDQGDDDKHDQPSETIEQEQQ